MTARYAILVRHGAYHQKPGTPSAFQPFPLTEAGKAQASDVGRELAALAAENGWALSPEVFCSRQQRAWQTATLLSQSLSELTGTAYTVTEDEALAERSVGAFANLTIPEIEQILADDPRYAVPPEDWKSNSHYKLPAQGAESLLEAGGRVAAFLTARLEALTTASDATAQIFVGHGAAFRHAAHHLGVLAFDDIRKVSMHHAKPVVLKFSPEAGWSHETGAWKQRQLLETGLD
ncbi:histidine phosphatase family protein [Roseibium sediminicola]|uniref:Histidine phosphatase family protein n=1 Tax=Roseibium sediminicola TaxID=2933272 RepID=A0ABT0GU06_9HYPH|nr:histidine phosphatase family protein [Roseibium sp. CAU 1639]MCK7612917.1 histidine phosphatase family protein [Roseibium sp. CAU 1639]